MKMKAPLGIMLTLLLLGVLPLSFNNPVQTETTAHVAVVPSETTTKDVRNRGYGLGMQETLACASSQLSSFLRRGRERLNAVGLEDSASEDGDSFEIVIGVDDAQPESYTQIRSLIVKNKGKLVDTVSMGGRIRAIVADVGSKMMSTFLGEAEVTGLSSYIEPNRKFRTNLVPNDPGWSKQWGLRKISADYAWNTTTGNPSVVVAIIDTGVDWDHPDIAANVWENTDEVLDGIDNDGNGFVDDIRGWDFVDTAATVWPGEDGMIRDNDPMDFHGHGTHVSGIVAAVTNNGIGVAGASWNCKIMAVRAGYKGADGYGYLEDDDAAEAIVYAADNGANIISMSWGAYHDSELIHDAIKYAYDSGVLLIAAAGNDFTSLEAYPAAYEEVIAVSATQQDDNPAPWTNFGGWIGLAAPGVDIYSTVWNDSYTSMDGTSMAAPCVAGVAALIKSRFPSMTRDQVRAQLQFTSDDLGDLGFDIHYGFGRVNARRAVENAPPNHDLLILRMQAPSIVRHGDAAVINTAVLNMGKSQEVDLTAQLLVDGVVVDSKTLSVLASGASISISYSWNTTIFDERVYNVTSYVVPAQGEIVTRNNAFSTDIWVRNPQVIRVPDDFEKIQDAVDAAFEGDTILVASGTYYGNVWINKEDLTLIGEDEHNTIIDANQTADGIVVTTDNVEISEFTIRGSSRDSSYYPPFSGILLSESKNSTIRNTITLNNRAGIFIFSSTGTTLRHNSMSGNTYNFGVDGYILSDFIHDVDESNVVDGKPISYLINENNKLVPTYSGCVVAVSSTKVVVRGLNLTKNYASILFAFTADSLVENVKISRSYIGIDVMYSAANVVLGNDITSADVGAYLYVSEGNYVGNNTITDSSSGIKLYNSANNQINSNELSNNSQGIFLRQSAENKFMGNKLQKNPIGIWLDHSEKNFVEFNEVTKGWVGITLTESDDNVVRGNLLSDIFSWRTSSWGIGLEWSYNNMIYHNNFVNNLFQAYTLESISTWDDGYPSGGNYWSDYAGTDFNGDGIGDTPYIIDENNRDRYPLIEHWTQPLPIIHDVAIVSVIPHTVEVYVGQVVNIAVIVKNDGNIIEKFAVTAKYELDGADCVIGTQIVSYLTPGANTTLTFTWTTTDITVHTLEAEIQPLAGETDITDNSMISPFSVKVKIIGDVNNDNKVDIRDISQAALSFGSYPKQPRWNIQADINQDNKVDIRDIALIAKNFGRTYP